MNTLSCLIKGGAQQISEKMLEKILENSSANKIVFNAETIEINQDELVEVKVRDTVSGRLSSYKAKKMVSAVPVNLISKIDFRPHLPMHKTNVLGSIRIGNYGKVIITYKNAFWKTNGFSGEVVSDGSSVILKNEIDANIPTRGPISVMYDASTNEGHAALVAFLAADGLVQWFGKRLQELGFFVFFVLL